MVYGRTRHVDSWWRAVPASEVGSPGAGWLAGPLYAVVQGGRELADGPRFLMARADAGLLVGVACRARDLAADLSSDGARELYCFVGWVGPGPAPSLADLARGYPQWAGVEYRRWVGPDWDASPAADPPSHPTTPGPPPWPELGPPSNPVEVPAVPGSVQIWPQRHAGELWAAVAAGIGPAVLVTGLRVARRGRLRGMTHAASADTTERYLLGEVAPPDGLAAPASDEAQSRSWVRTVLDLVRRIR